MRASIGNWKDAFPRGPNRGIPAVILVLAIAAPLSKVPALTQERVPSNKGAACLDVRWTGSGRGTRTPDTRVNSPVLYQLSYARMWVLSYPMGVLWGAPLPLCCKNEGALTKLSYPGSTRRLILYPGQDLNLRPPSRVTDGARTRDRRGHNPVLYR